MKVKIVFYHVIHEVDPITFPETIEFVSSIDSGTTIQQLFEEAGYPLADLSEYYYLSGHFSFNSSFLPFIINSNGIIEWNISYESAQVIDFISTHNLENNIIIAKIGYPQAGGPGFKDLIEIWEIIYPILDQFVTMVGLGAILINGGKWVNLKFQRKDIPPQSYFDLIFSRVKWNHFELAELIGVNSQDAKQILKIFGYKYDKSKLLYIQQPISIELREKLSKVNVLDV